ncbi:MAG: polysaccharide pyruvyl transferase family protein [Clostridia bacterium]|nr:polysaccharide pyruvyl transferase family protein [Clostridia bacterium]
MKIGIITFQMAWNCGAVLQCVALKKKLESMGHYVTVINYQPSYKDYRYCKYQNPITVAYKTLQSNSGLNKKKKLVKAAKSAVRAVLNWDSRSGRLKQKHDFEEFCKKYLNLSQEYKSIEELRSNPPECDIYISGSDQLWNPNLTNDELDPAYFLDFGNEDIVRATYAISACELDVAENREQLEKLMDRLDFISLREVEKKEELELVSKKKIDICIDPTLLLDADCYEEIELSEWNETEPYLLVYALDNPGSNDTLFKTVKELSERKKLKIKVISGPHKWPYKIEEYCPRDGISPQEFLSYIKHSQIVVTNSFHASTFSLIYQKDFYVVTTPGRSSRVVELLDKLGLNDRILSSEKPPVDFDYEDIQYENIKNRILTYRKPAEEYLEMIAKERK